MPAVSVASALLESSLPLSIPKNSSKPGRVEDPTPHRPKATLYTFATSSWSASVRIARIELGLCDTIEIKQLDFMQAENMSPSYIKLTPNATIPALSTPEKAYCDTTEVIDYMASVSDVQIAARTSLTGTVHHRRVDSKTLIFAARNEAELSAKVALGLPLRSLESRLPRIKDYAKSPQGAQFREKYTAKIAFVEQLIAIYTFTAPESVMSEFYTASQNLHDATRHLLYRTLPAFIRENNGGKFGPFVAGDVPGVDDFHVVSWVVHVGFFAGAKRGEDIIDALSRYYNEDVPEEVVSLMRAWISRESFKSVYSTRIW